MDELISWLGKVKKVLEVPILTLNDKDITLWSVLYVLVLIILLFWAAKRVQNLLSQKLLIRTNLDPAGRHAVGTIVHYLLLLVGFLIILQLAGIDLTTLHVLAGAVGIGVGFGLQSVISNFFAGLIIMFERPIKIGDRIEVDGVDGDVVEIGVRSTVVLTNDNIAIIVPNSKFITENVVNWQYNDGKVRFCIPVGVAYGSDVKLVQKVLLEVAKEAEDVLESPQPVVRLLEFGDSSLNFELRVWSETQINRKGRLTSIINLAVYEKFREHGIEIPFPQRDLHVRSGLPGAVADQGDDGKSSKDKDE
jgi:small-conductance mechanosensitive channel